MKVSVLLLFVLLFSFTLAQNKKQPMTKDVHTFANSDEIAVSHLDLNLTADFTKKILSGKATLTLSHKKKSNTLILDTRDLTIEKVTLDEKETPAKFSLGNEVQYLGRPLTISLTPKTKTVTIYYSTSPNAAALQWLEPSQTAGKKFPYLFTQSEAILARTWVPCQDGPGIRFTYSAVIHTPAELMAVMSAAGNATAKNDSGTYHFKMKQAIPSYLLALAIGDLDFRPIGNRCGVYSEPAMVEKAAYEFADMEKMVEAAEELYGLYRWERYDVIVLPPSFPFGGMENPRLTFATPTVIAGDRSLVALVAHELAHSWSGNLVTNATWNDFWLNEGFTTYFEHRIMEKLYGRTYSEMLAVLTLKDLHATINELGASRPNTKLKLDLVNRDPDDGMTDIAYNKGYFFLRLCEETFGREQWDAFLKKYFNEHAFQSMTTEQFVEYFKKNLLAKNKALASKINYEEWIYQPGLPANCPQPKSAEFEKVTAQLNAFLSGTPATQLETKNWTTHHWLYFLGNLPDTLSKEKMIELDYTFNFTRTGNSEIACEWFLHCIKAHYETAYGPLKNFLMSVGRRKFLKPLYSELAKKPEDKTWAKEVYAQARAGYHSVSANTIDGILK